MKKCRECSEDFEPKRSSQLFCSKPCTNRFSRINASKRCKCGGTISRYSLVCIPCAAIDKKQETINKWLLGLSKGGTTRGVSTAIRNYLLGQADFKCSICSFDTPHPEDGSSVLEIDHIDGDGDNHRPENLRVLCPNCHSLTPTYRGRNMGNGRKVWYSRNYRE